MTPEQILAIKCAHADLQGSMEAKQNNDLHSHDWKAHALTIQELEEAFDFLKDV